jgi:hypothetical protein
MPVLLLTGFLLFIVFPPMLRVCCAAVGWPAVNAMACFRRSEDLDLRFIEPGAELVLMAFGGVREP